MRSKIDRSPLSQDAAQEEALQNRRVTAHQFFFGYAYDLFRHARFYTLWRNLLAYFRKIRMVTLILKILTVTLTVLQTGALVLLSTVLFVIILPILIALMLGILLTALLESRKSNRLMKNRLHEKQVYILFLSKQENTFFASNAKNLAQKEKSAVIVISPYWISGKGLVSKHFFCTVRREAENLYLVRRYYFFKLKKHVLGDDVTYIF